MSRYDVIAIGASAGGLFALSEVLRHLPADFPATVLIVQHLSPRHKSHLSELLGHVTALAVCEASDGVPLMAAMAYVAPRDEHLVVKDGVLRLVHSEAVRFVRPSIDLLFESVAQQYGDRAVGVILSGALRDGTRGVQCIKEAGGVTLAEDPSDAEFPSMPLSAVSTGCVDRVLPLAEMGPALISLCSGEPNSNGG